jgi:hypothetical protein
VENNPTFSNLLGKMEKESYMGTVYRPGKGKGSFPAG